ncbi:nucleolin 1 isoform X6 [Neltuma alba]|uniref:nucleolin 1 isoform X6 n=1 Tax=Neltuma alba TaxID=207710 RepID=UPI0010A3C6EF|nr:nucleolin 1-like isoform X6 [Prosopis alba]
MGESGKKSDLGFDAAVAGVSPSKSAMIGKRESEDEPEKQVTAKKQKRDWDAENQKKESSSDDSFLDSANSDEDSALNDSNVAPAEGKSGPSAVRKKGESRSDTGSSSVDKDDIKIEATIVREKLPNAGEKEPAKKVDSSKPSGLDSDSKTNEDMDNVTTSSKKSLATSAAGNNKSTHKFVSSNDSSLDSGLDEDDVQKTRVTSSSKKLLASAVVQREGIGKNENPCYGSREGFDECNVSEGNEEIEEKPCTTQKDVKDEEMVDVTSMGATRKGVPKTALTLEKQNATSKKIFVGNLSLEMKRANLENLFKGCGEIVDVSFGLYRDGTFRGFAHVEFATEEAAQNALMLNGSELLRRFVRIEIAREKFAYTPNSRNNTLKGFQAFSGDGEPTMLATSKEQNATSKMLFVGNLSYSVERADLENLFKDCGEIIDIRLATDREGRFKGFGHIEFATYEAAQTALKLNGSELLRQYIRLDLAHEKIVHSFNSGIHGNTENSGSVESQTVFVRGFDTSLREDEIRTSLGEHFSSCGLISRISIARDYDTGSTKGYAWVDFMDIDGLNKALELDGTEVGGYVLSVEKRRPRRYIHDGRGGGDQLGGWRGGDQFGGWRGGDQFGGWRGVGQWDQGRGYGRRWH